MPDLFISPEFLPKEQLKPNKRSLSGFLRQLFAPTLQGQWVDGDGESVGKPMALPRRRKIPVEFGDGKGGFSIAEVLEALTIPDNVPAGADRLRIMLGTKFIVSEVTLMALGKTARPAKAKEKQFPEQGGAFRIDVISERFSSEDAFFECVEQLYHHWTTDHYPFNQKVIKERFAIRALFWHSDEQEGNFHTPDSAIEYRVLKGNAELVRSYQEAHGDPADFALVLINSQERAGAGGAVFKRQWAPAWVTTKSEEWEEWWDIALHELGHSFGLADEYDAPPYELEVTHFEPNVTKQSTCGNAPNPWANMCVSAPEPYNRLFDDKRPVTNIQGARYCVDSWYRPHPDCLMRTSTATFCPVCTEYLGLRILGHVDPPYSIMKS